MAWHTNTAQAKENWSIILFLEGDASPTENWQSGGGQRTSQDKAVVKVATTMEDPSLADAGKEHGNITKHLASKQGLSDNCAEGPASTATNATKTGAARASAA